MDMHVCVCVCVCVRADRQNCEAGGRDCRWSIVCRVKHLLYSSLTHSKLHTTYLTTRNHLYTIILGNKHPLFDIKQANLISHS
jgi:hypothetical protein